ncbi:hypothetical protein MSPP1_002975 [Malassezia sp. CBS 17886]|nr:hypothetical protein MSPP1_002975 [Malassezia sp. CBS 17886]
MTAPQVQFSGPYGGGVVPGAGLEGGAAIPGGLNMHRRTSVSAESMSSTLAQISTRDVPNAFVTIPKTEDQQRRLLAAVADTLLFRHLDPDALSTALGAMKEVQRHTGEIVIKQGNQGDYFYVIESGELEVYVLPPGTDPAVALAAPPDQLGRKAVTLGAGASFGELALLYMQPRAASVMAVTDCTLWALDRVTFRSILTQTSVNRRSMFQNFLSQVPLFQKLEEGDRVRIADVLEIEEYNAGEVVVREGEPGTHFYIIIHGVAEVHKAGDAAHPVGKLQRGDYFGELALMSSSPRAATVLAAPHPADTTLKVAAIGEKAFTRLLGPLTGAMTRHAETHYGNPVDDVRRAHLMAPSADVPPGSPRSPTV